MKKGIDLDGEVRERDEEYYWDKSQKCFKIKDVTGVIFGGFSSRFWSFRK